MITLATEMAEVVLKGAFLKNLTRISEELVFKFCYTELPESNANLLKDD